MVVLTTFERFVVKSFVLLTCLTLALTGCGMSKYETYWEPVQTNSGVSLARAMQTCSAEAAQAGAIAASSASANATTGGGFAGGFASSLNQGLAGPLARQSAMNSCMAGMGFRKQKMCVSNC